MNKMNAFVLMGFMVCTAQNTFSIGEEQREILYALHGLGQDFSKVPMITENIDMFMGIVQMNIKTIEIKLEKIQAEVNTALAKSLMIVAGTALAKIIVDQKVLSLFHALEPIVIFTKGMIRGFSHSGSIVGASYAALNVYDVLKDRNILRKLLALDREILSQLQDIQESLEQNSALAGTNLLESSLESESKN